MIASSRHRWLDRLLGAAVGIAAAAWWFGPSRDDATVTESDPIALREGTTDDGDREVPDEGPVPLAIDRRSSGDLALATATTSPTAGHAVDVSPRGPAADRGSPAIDAPPSPADTTPSRSPAAASDRAPLAPDAAPIEEPGTAPDLPLPRMPGDTKLSNTARWDAESASWVLKGAYRVHARSHHVIAFYRKALLDQGLSVSVAEDPPTDDGAVKTYLRGKSSRVHAQVGIMPRTDSLETRVWILWRTRA